MRKVASIALALLAISLAVAGACVIMAVTAWAAFETVMGVLDGLPVPVSVWSGMLAGLALLALGFWLMVGWLVALVER